jgi:hypothetical protein
MVVNGRRRAPTDIDCAKRRAKPDQAGPRGSQNHAAVRDVEQLAQMLDRVRLHRSLSQDFVATLKLAEELIVQVVAIGEKNQRRILHRRLFDDRFAEPHARVTAAQLW